MEKSSDLIPDSPDEMAFGHLRVPIPAVRSSSYAESGCRVVTDPTGERRNRQFRQRFRGLQSCRPNPSVGVDGPRRHRVCQNEVVADLRQRRPSVEQISRIGMDTSKHIFQLHGANAAEVPVLRKKLRRKEMFAFFARLAPTVIAIEAAGSVALSGAACPGRSGAPATTLPRIPLCPTPPGRSAASASRPR
jgi:hypothetical protein